MNTPNNVINPFSEKFLETWDLWKNWRKEHDGFKYKGNISEQMALKKLIELADGEEEKAVAIIEQSICREWLGFYPLKQQRKNGKSKQQSSDTESNGNSLRQQAINEFMRRNGGGGQSDNNEYLKAV